ncbi:hypothetical protein M8542_38365 [Amycolatopsis sp. OK19-0408]|uniref:Uncharacterized protein n=1 Tax=Amycolatopsis iheyensis TaxID=2945988 RepID=A0A9X2SQJ2_9PSEU|nr:hypothetical protein [Amycolatopsis iheyensis]MCR6488710.1 hypothetical protein [Amycolatopsis iheyensis]
MDVLRDVVWRHAAGMVYPEDLPMVAAEALARGVDSPALRELAGLGKGSATTEIENLYRDALAELGITAPGRREAVRWWLGELAEELVQGGLSVAGLARKIVPGEEWMAEDEYRFAVLAYYWQETVDLISAPQARAAEIDLLDAARAILRQNNSSRAGAREHP